MQARTLGIVLITVSGFVCQANAQTNAGWYRGYAPPTPTFAPAVYPMPA